MVKVIAIDVDGTMLKAESSVPVVGVVEMLSTLAALGIRTFAVSNRAGSARRVQRSGLQIDSMLTMQDVGKPKGSPAWVDRICSDAGIEKRDLVWLGDTDYDMFSAANAGVAYFNAAWSSPEYRYGFPARSPEHFALIVGECFIKNHPWFWQLRTTDRSDRRVDVYALMDGMGAGNARFRRKMLNTMKYDQDPLVGRIPFREFVLLHLLGSLYASGMIDQFDVWSVYPGSRGGTHPGIQPYADLAARMFRDRPLHDLFERHTQSKDSGRSRNAGLPGIDFLNQINTVKLNDRQAAEIAGKRVLVVDDFTTRGYSLECARNLLLQAGASAVTGVVVGKYGGNSSVLTPQQGHEWNPVDSVLHSASDFIETWETGTVDSQALDEIRASFERVEVA